MTTIHPSKTLFKLLGKILKLTEIECYTLYLDNALDFRLDFNSLSENLETDSEIAESFYGLENEPPRFFNYKNYTDWCRINNNLLPRALIFAFL